MNTQMSATNKCPEKISIPISDSNQTIIDILNSQYGHLESGEVRTQLESFYDKVWNDAELVEQFAVSHFEPPYVHVIRKEDKARGTIMFVDSPRFYFSFSAESEDDERNQTRV